MAGWRNLPHGCLEELALPCDSLLVCLHLIVVDVLTEELILAT